MRVLVNLVQLGSLRRVARKQKARSHKTVSRCKFPPR